VTPRVIHGKVTGLVITFNGPLASGSAGNAANYSFHLLRLGRRSLFGQRQLKMGKQIGVGSVEYSPSSHQVTLSFATRLPRHQMLQVRINGGQGGITDASGNSLNSPSRGVTGSDFVYNVS
jgi:hypothetical protein